MMMLMMKAPTLFPTIKFKKTKAWNFSGHRGLKSGSEKPNQVSYKSPTKSRTTITQATSKFNIEDLLLEELAGISYHATNTICSSELNPNHLRQKQVLTIPGCQHFVIKLRFGTFLPGIIENFNWPLQHLTGQFLWNLEVITRLHHSVFDKEDILVFQFSMWILNNLVNYEW